MMSENDKLLIQAGVDGELDAADQTRLEHLLAESEEARHLHEDLTRLGEFLERIPSQPVPEHLRSEIVGQVKLPGQGLFQRLFAPRSASGWLPYGMATAAVVLLTVVVIQNRSVFDEDMDYSSMVGTMAKVADGSGGQSLDQMTFSAEGAEGTVNLVLRGDAYVLEFDLQSSEPVGFDVNIGGNNLSFQGFMQSASKLDVVRYESNVISGQGSGRQRFLVVMQRGEKAAQAGSATKIDLAFSTQGELIHRGALASD